MGMVIDMNILCVSGYGYGHRASIPGIETNDLYWCRHTATMVVCTLVLDIDTHTGTHVGGCV